MTVNSRPRLSRLEEHRLGAQAAYGGRRVLVTREGREWSGGTVLVSYLSAETRVSESRIEGKGLFARDIEDSAARKLLDLVPAALQPDYRPLFFPDDADRKLWALVHAADKLCAWIKCLEELSAGNQEFTKAEKTLRETVDALDLPEVREFVRTFVPGIRLTLDELG